MKHIFITRLILLPFLALLLCMLPILGLASESPIPTIDRITFDQALQEDKLTLTLAREIEFGDGECPLSLSPDGDKLLLLSDDGLSVCTLANGTRTLLTPNKGNSRLTEEHILKLFATPEVTAMSWSADGRYLSFSFPANVYMRMMADCNVWITDMETCVTDPLFDLPEGISMVDLRSENPPTIPVRAAFDPYRPVLHYDMLIADETDEDAPLKNRYFQWNYETGETVLTGEIPFYLSSGDSKLWLFSDYLATTAAYNGGIVGGAGVVVIAKGKTSSSALARDGFLAAFLYGARLVATHESSAVLYQQGRGYELAYGYNKSTRQIMHLMECSLNDQGEAQYGSFLAVDTDAPAQSRLLRFLPEELDDDETNAVLFERYARNEVNVCFNVTFSPDDGYLLLAAQGLGGSKGLYVLNRVTGECGRIMLPEDFEVVPDARALGYEVGPYRLPGIQWSAGNRLLLFDGNMSRLYALAVQP